MANEFNNAIKSAAQKISEYVHDISELTVETRYDAGAQMVSAQGGTLARTEIHMDGDCVTTVPGRLNQANAMVVDNELFEVHQRNVQVAIDYRAKMIASLIDLLRNAPPQA